jgi:transposase
MGKRIQIASYLSVEQLRERYRYEGDGRTRIHWQILWHIAAGKTTQEVAMMTGLTLRWIRAIVHRYNEQGPAYVGDQRHQNPGGPRVLTPEHEAALSIALDRPSPDGGRWTGPKVAQWISAHARRSVTKDTGRIYLRRLTFCPQLPRPQHAEADPVEQAELKKTPADRATDASGVSGSVRGIVGV